MKFYISEETGSVIWYKNGVPMFCPIHSSNVVDTDEAGEAELELVGDELVRLKDGEQVTLKNYYLSLKPDIEN